MNCDYAIPKNKKIPADFTAADRHIEFQLGWFAHPIFVDGDYPSVMRHQVDKKSKDLDESRLPHFTDDEKQLIKGIPAIFFIVSGPILGNPVYCPRNR